MFKLKVNVEPWATLVEVGLTVAEREGAVFTSKEALPESGLHVPEILTDIDCEVAVPLAVKVVQDTLELLIDLVVLSDTLQTGQPLKSRLAELQSPDQPEAVTVKVLPDITLLGSAPDWLTVTVTVALTKTGNKNNTSNTDNKIFIFTNYNSLHRTIFPKFHFLPMFEC
jgi:hypothetical protein